MPDRSTPRLLLFAYVISLIGSLVIVVDRIANRPAVLVDGRTFGVALTTLTMSTILTAIAAVSVWVSLRSNFLWTRVTRAQIGRHNLGPAVQYFFSRLVPVALVFAVGFSSENYSTLSGLTSGFLAAAIAWLVAEQIDRLGSEKYRNRILVGGLATHALVLTALLITRTPDYAPLTIPAENGGERPQKIAVIGIDGADWKIVNDLLERGQLPALARLRQRGTLAPLHTLEPTSSPFLWNAMYTGFTPALHYQRPEYRPIGNGALLMTQALSERVPFNPINVLGNLLSVGPAFRFPLAYWDVFARSGYATTVLGAWQQGPVTPVGLMHVSIDAEYAPERLNKHLGLDHSPFVWLDAAVRDDVSKLDLIPAEIDKAEWLTLLGSAANVEAIMADASMTKQSSPEQKRRSRLLAAFASDRLRYSLALRALEHMKPPYLLHLYFRGVDLMQHCYMHLYRGEPAAAGEDQLRDIIAAYYRQVDRWVGDVATRLGDDTTVFIVSDHGIDIDEKLQHSYKSGFHYSAPHGIVMASGPHIAPRPITSAHILDIAPTLLALGRIPTLAAVEGRVLAEVTTRTPHITDWLSRETTSYDRGNPALSTPEVEEQLKALGYVQ
jgi:hypothetical protein